MFWCLLLTISPCCLCLPPQEMARYNRLLAVIRGSLKNMALALRGLLVMSGELEAAFNSIALNQVSEPTHADG
jgi:hypothetical protein